MVEHIFISPKVRRGMVISNKLAYTSCPRVAKRIKTNDYQEIRKYQRNPKTSQNYWLLYSPPPKIGILSGLAKIL